MVVCRFYKAMRFSILGFNQERVMALTAVEINNDKEVVLSLDVNDLLILNLMADFPNRTKVKKIMKDDKIFFWASYDEIIKELPILNVKKHALANRFDKLEKLHLIEREYLTINSKNNLTFFCLTKTYESLLYGEPPYRSQMQHPIAVECDTLSQSNAIGSSSQVRDRNNNIINNNIAEDRTDTNVSYEGEPSRSKEDVIDWNAFLKFFNDTMANKAIKSITIISKARKESVRARMREYGKKALFDVIQKAAASDFLNGKSQRGFLASFDWMFKPMNFPKVLEGNYDNRDGMQFNNNNNYNLSRDEQRAIEVQRRKEGAADIIARLAAEEQCDNA